MSWRDAAASCTCNLITARFSNFGKRFAMFVALFIVTASLPCFGQKPPRAKEGRVPNHKQSRHPDHDEDPNHTGGRRRGASGPVDPPQSICSNGNGIATDNATTVGTLDLKAAMQGIAYQACYSGDANTNNTVTVQYKQHSSGTWLTASTTLNGRLINPYNDRRATINGVTNTYYQQFRGSIVGLQPNTNYDVQVTFSDSDGVVGGPTISGTISTVTTTPRNGGNTCTATDDTSLSTCLSGTSGTVDNIHLNAATYTGGITISRSGTSGDYLVIDCDHAGGAHISGGSPTIQINANFVVLQYCDLPSSAATGISIGTGQHDIYIQNNTMDSVNSLCSEGSGVDLRFALSNIWILNNTIHQGFGDCGPTQVDGDDTVSGQAIDIEDGGSVGVPGLTSVTISGNTITGVFDDGITQNSAAASPQIENIEVIGNTIQDYKDDGIEFKIMSINNRAIGNTVIGNNAVTCFAANSNLQNGQSYGPVYFVRNNCHISSSAAGAVWKIGNTNNGNEALPFFAFHNSLYENGSVHSVAHFDCESGAKQTIYFINNIYYGQGNYLSRCNPYGEPGATLGDSLWDYNDVFTCCNSYGFNLNNFTNANPSAFSDWQAEGPNEDQHSINSSTFPFVSATNLHLVAGSPVIDKGVVLYNFNDANSTWPYSGAAPDIGAFELSTGNVTTSITATAGTPQSTAVNTSFPTAMAATVTDSSNNPVGGITVTFAAPGSGASGTFTGGLTTTSSTTNSRGVATAPSFTANGTAGSYTVTATVSGVSAPANFNLTNISAPPGCSLSAASWQSQSFPTQTGSFTASFDATPSAANNDGVIGLSSGIATAPTDLAAIVRFNISGFIDVVNGTAYTSDTAVRYTANTSYHFRLVVNIPSHTYSVFVTPQAGSEVAIATNYAFRSEQATATNLSYLSSFSSVANTTICNLIAPAFDFVLSSSGDVSVTQGSSVNNTITATLTSGTTQGVSLSVSGLPIGVTSSFSMTSCNPTCTSTLTLNASLLTLPGSYTITVSGTSERLTNTTSFVLTVNLVFIGPVANTATTGQNRTTPTGTNNDPPENNVDLSVPDNACAEWFWTGNTSSAIVGYANLQMNKAHAGYGIAMVTEQLNGVVVAETGVPASSSILSGRTYVNLKPPVSTGISFANSGNQDAVISFYFTDATGTDFGRGSFMLTAHGQISALLNEPPFNGLSSMEGTFTFSSSVPVGAVTLQGLINQRGEFLYTTVPFAPVNGSTSDPVIIPDFADGGGWTTEVILINPSDGPITGTVEFYSQGTNSQNGQPKSVTINGASNSIFHYSMPPHTGFRLTTQGGGLNVDTGSVQIHPSSGAAPTSAAILSYANNGITVTEASVSGLSTGTAFRTYAEIAGIDGQAESIETRAVIANPSPNAVAVSLQVTGMDGSAVGQSVSVTVPGKGQISQSVRTLIATLPAGFRGLLKVTSHSPIAFAGLHIRYNERGEFLITAMGAQNDGQAAPASDVVLPHIVKGYGTHIVACGP